MRDSTKELFEDSAFQINIQLTKFYSQELSVLKRIFECLWTFQISWREKMSENLSS